MRYNGQSIHVFNNTPAYYVYYAEPNITQPDTEFEKGKGIKLFTKNTSKMISRVSVSFISEL